MWQLADDLLDVVEQVARAARFAPAVLGRGHGEQRFDCLAMIRITWPLWLGCEGVHVH